MAGHLGKGLGALFPSLTPQPAQDRQNAGQNTRDTARPTVQDLRKTHVGQPSDTSAKNQPVVEGRTVKAVDKASKAGAKTASASVPDERPLATSTSDRHGNTPNMGYRDTGHVRNATDSGRQAGKAGNAADDSRRQDRRQQAGGQHNNTRRHSGTPHIPDWDEIAHPVDLFFGGAGLAPARPDSVSHRMTAHPGSGIERAEKPSDRMDGTRKADALTSDAPASGSSTASESENVSRETSVQVPGISNAQATVAASSKTAVAEAGADQDGRTAGQDVVTEPLKPVNGAYLTQIRVNDIIPNPKQPRTVFDEDELRELSDSIKEVGVLQPVVVIKRDQDQGASDQSGAEDKDTAENRESTEDHGVAEDQDLARGADRQDTTHYDNAHYELVMGERRWRASKLAGLEAIPAIVRTATSEQLLRDALLENLQRVQLNPLEEAAAYQQMMQEFGLTQQKLSEAVSKSRPQIANTLRLLQLPAPVQKLVTSGVLSAGHARALLTLTSHKQMIELADRIVKEGLSVRSTEEIVALHSGKKGAAKRASSQLSADYWAGTGIPERLEDRLQTKVAIRGNEKKGRIVITFASREDLDRLTQLLSGASDSDKDEDGWV